ncbi:MAG TPA: YbdK family carboxylate-amine ligase [Zoogloea sp.]|uniref:YbdK family carboxylate-amine ligase n=1 Tax=Zoogloea sp. TaxID=49181 RepID=UPI002C9F368C|nr:YbdK family carboxylate-amine ligase [Zoogloea sp.]HOB45488.1 YbdK family carboxylate-amine ligase [Zoogloea sp.]HQA09606.1 YbdK family carboxylate-amine ligase [Zoogloea sp.]
MSDLSRMTFTSSRPLTLGVELELQLVSLRDYDLTRAATDLLAGLRYDDRFGEVKLEITESMIEVNSRPRQDVTAIAADLEGLRDVLVTHCRRNNIAICGGGTHPFHHWPERRICPGERFAMLNERYGYLSKQFTVFGQHIHIGVTSGDDAIWLTHALNGYVPHFVALSASSPFLDATDTGFESARLNAVSAFPLSGQAPDVADWTAFLDHMALLQSCGVAESIKDLYWDVRPKPEFGTVEVRVCDTPLTVDRATELAAFAQCLSRYLLRERPPVVPAMQALVARYNKFQACRFGFAAELADPIRRRTEPLGETLPALIDMLAGDADALGCGRQMENLKLLAESRYGDAAWLRATARAAGNLHDLTRAAAQRFAQPSFYRPHA